MMHACIKDRLIELETEVRMTSKVWIGVQTGVKNDSATNLALALSCINCQSQDQDQEATCP